MECDVLYNFGYEFPFQGFRGCDNECDIFGIQDDSYDMLYN